MYLIVLLSMLFLFLWFSDWRLELFFRCGIFLFSFCYLNWVRGFWSNAHVVRHFILSTIFLFCFGLKTIKYFESFVVLSKTIQLYIHIIEDKMYLCCQFFLFYVWIRYSTIKKRRYNGFLFPHSYSGEERGAWHLSTNTEKETRFIQYGKLLLFQ